MFLRQHLNIWVCHNDMSYKNDYTCVVKKDKRLVVLGFICRRDNKVLGNTNNGPTIIHVYVELMVGNFIAVCILKSRRNLSFASF